ncbi:hypothetical protein Tco_0948871 [Tanacetum coccineum]
METIHVTFNELTTMSSEQFSSGPEIQFLTFATSSSGVVPNPIPQQPSVREETLIWGSFIFLIVHNGGQFEYWKAELEVVVHGAPISKEDINQKFLRSLPPSWNQIALIMRNKPDIDEIDIDDLYNNLRVYEDEMKRSSSSTSNSHNLAFLSSENTNSTNKVSTVSGDFGVSTAGGTSQVPSTPCAHDINGDDLEELDLRWQMVMLTVRKKKFIQRTGRNMDFKEKRYVSLDKSNAPTNGIFITRALALQITDTVCRSFLVSTSFTQGKVSSISIGGSISSEGFLSSILLLVVIIVMVVFVVVVLVVVVIAIVGVVIVVVFGIVVVVVPLVPVFLLVLSVFAIDAACAFRAEEMPSLISCRMAAKVMAGVSDVDVLLGGILSTKDNTGYDKDGDNDANGGNDDEREIIEEEDGNGFRFYGGNSFSKNKGNIDDQIVRDGRYIERWSQNSW